MSDYLEEEQKNDPLNAALRDMTDAFSEIEKTKMDRQEAMMAPPLHPGYQAYCMAHEYAWRQTIKYHVYLAPQVVIEGVAKQPNPGPLARIDRFLAKEIHRIALLAAENWAPPELEAPELVLEE